MQENYIELLENYFIEDPRSENIILNQNNNNDIDYKTRRRKCYFILLFIFLLLSGTLIYLIIKK